VTVLRLRSVLACCVFTACASNSLAADLLPNDRPIEQVIDHYIDLKLKAENVTAAPQADDANLIRRLTLDLVGRIPTVAETKAFVESTDADKRVKLVERLMASPAFVRHQATELDTMLMYGLRGSVRDYLLKALAEDRSWDRIFRELVLSDETDAARKGAGEFIRQRVSDLDRLTNDVSVIFFGVNISCAQCHDHPKVPDWKQDHFFGMKAFFGRTFDNGGFVAERETAEVKFRTTDGKEKLARLMFLTGTVVEEPARAPLSPAEQKKEKELFENAKKNKQPPPRPNFSARSRLVDLALEPGQREFFARSIVNRLWHRLYGNGLVMPLDQMHSKNPASHPELLEWLARDTAEHNYDLRRLIRGLVLSQAYARTSRWEGDDPPATKLFAVAAVRPLTPMQLALSLRVATVAPSKWPALDKTADFERRIEGMESAARGFASTIEQPRENFQIGVTEALLFSNSDRVQKEYLGDNGDLIVGAVKALSDEKERVDMAVRNVFARPPSEDEIKALGKYLRDRADRPAEACRQMIWALLTSSEFRFNY
jgi:hypothetical protein